MVAKFSCGTYVARSDTIVSEKQRKSMWAHSTIQLLTALVRATKEVPVPPLCKMRAFSRGLQVDLCSPTQKDSFGKHLDPKRKYPRTSSCKANPMHRLTQVEKNCSPCLGAGRKSFFATQFVGMGISLELVGRFLHGALLYRPIHR